MPKSAHREFAPYPEIADPNEDGGYTVIDTLNATSAPVGGTDRDSRTMLVPIDAEGVEISRHELAHAKWSPKAKPQIEDKLDNACMQGVEEARVNNGLARVGIPFRQPSQYARELLELQLKAYLTDEFGDALIRYIAVQGTAIEKVFDELSGRFVKQGDEHARWVAKKIRKFRRKMWWARLVTRQTVPTFQRGQRVSEWVAKEIRKHDKDDGKHFTEVKKTQSQTPRPAKGGGGMPGSVPPSEGLKSFYRGQSLTETSKGLRNWMPKGSSFFKPFFTAVVPGEMEIRTPDLTIPLVRPDLERVTKARASEEGTEIRHIERFVSDQRVFRRRAKERKGGGTVLLDVSSTMDLSDGDVRRIVAGAPEATKVATYCGDASTGLLSIVVDKGRRASPFEVARRFGAGNNCDPFALDWLAHQPTPRVWFTDGGVTGVGHATDKAYRDLCATIVEENGIIQCETIGQVCAALRREREDRKGIFVPRDDDREDDPDEDECSGCEYPEDDCRCCSECGYYDCECGEDDE